MAAEVRMGEFTADFGKTAADYGKHRVGFPPELFDRLAMLVIARQCWHWFDRPRAASEELRREAGQSPRHRTFRLDSAARQCR